MVEEEEEEDREFGEDFWDFWAIANLQTNEKEEFSRLTLSYLLGSLAIWEEGPLAQIDNNIPVPGEEWPPSTCIWTLFIDGASNQHGCGVGIVLVDPEGVETSHCIRFEFRATNNKAEYEALFAGLTVARELGARFLAIKSDSQLIVKQVAGTYQAKGNNMSAYLEKVQQAIKAFQMVKMEQIPRGANHRADVLAKIATGGGQTPPGESGCSF
ncbi:hypothetical protein LWI29_036630 [Acer saccharum]|uniref:RNase H type-1 domain-containing protein n=1 Tax=Acer saccharum TaxID=4024 RepID=A0AA39SEW7_ACESA|nr:hypothetical protein LWI29_036630 [Acer saccharum]